MRISEDARKCSVFIGYTNPSAGDPNQFVATGTGFFIFHESAVYLITAAHVARAYENAPFCLRMNQHPSIGQEVVLVQFDDGQWLFHQDVAVDVAALQIDLTGWAFDAAALPSREFMDEERLRHYDIGPGDSVYVVGLFALHTGKRRNMPVVHSGHIALMPSDERIPVNRGDGSYDMVEAYLVEAHAIPGSSGSLVVVRPTISFIEKDHEAELETLVHGEGREFLLGIWVANWPMEPDKVLANLYQLPPARQIPIGMGMVIAASKIMDVLMQPKALEGRAKALQEADKKRAASPNSAGVAPSGQALRPTFLDENPRHREDFTSLLHKAAKTSPRDG